MKITEKLRLARIKARAKRKAKLAPIQSGVAGRFTRSRADRHQGLDIPALRKRRAANKVARKQRRVNRQASRR